MKRNYIGVAVGLLSTCFLFGCRQTAEEDTVVMLEQEQEEVTYKLGEVQKKDIVQTQKVKCTYKQMKDQEVSFSLGGKRVEKVYVRKGDTVKKGQLLAQLSGGNLDSRIEQLEYYIARNKLLLEYADVNEANDISERWVQEIYNGWPGAEESVKSIQKNYRYQKEDLQDAIDLDETELAKLKAEKNASSVYAQMDGVVYSIKDGLEGSTSKKDEVVMTVIDSTECIFVTESPELVSSFQEGVTVSMNLTGKNTGTYELMPYKMETWGEEQYFSIFSGPDNEGMEVGTYGYIDLVTDSKTNVLAVSNKAIYKAGDEYYVYVVGENNMREVQWIQIGLAGDDDTEVVEGLQEGDKVILK